MYVAYETRIHQLVAHAEITVDGCWTWTGYINHNGYGRVRHEGRQRQAHRWSYELFVGPIPERLVLDHICRNRACVRPDHLEAVTQSVNVLRGNPSNGNVGKTHCKWGHEFTPENTQITRSGKRRCQTCSRNETRARRQRKAVAA